MEPAFTREETIEKLKEWHPIWPELKESTIYHLTHPEIPAGEWISWPAEKALPEGIVFRYRPDQKWAYWEISSGGVSSTSRQVFVPSDPRVPELEAEVETLRGWLAQMDCCPDIRPGFYEFVAGVWTYLGTGPDVSSDARVKELEKEVAELKSKSKDLNEEIGMLEAERDRLKDDLCINIGRVEFLRPKVDSLESKLATAESCHSRCLQSNIELQVEVNSLRAQLPTPEDKRAMRAWRKWKEHSTSLGNKFWFITYRGDLIGHTDRQYPGYCDTPEAAVEAVCKPKSTTLADIPVGKFGKAESSGIYYRSAGLGLLGKDFGGHWISGPWGEEELCTIHDTEEEASR